MKYLIPLTLLTLVVAASSDEIPIGYIVSDWNEYSGVFSAIKIALNQHRHNASLSKDFTFMLFADRIKTVDAFKLSRIICRQLERGIFALLGTVDPESFDTLLSYANAFEMPFVAPWFPESMYRGPKPAKKDFAIQIRPEYHQGLIDLALYYEWDRVVYLYSDFDGLLRLQRIYNTVPKNVYGGYKVQVELARKIGSANEAIEVLLELEKVNRNSVKRVMLDCPAAMAKEILIKHVNNVHLGRRNFHYLMSSLILDDDWDSKVAEFGAVNITGFRLIDPTTDLSRQFRRNWKQQLKELDEEYELTSDGVLAYDAVNVMQVAFSSLMQQRAASNLRNSIRFTNANKRSKDSLSCDMSADDRQKSWEHGHDILKALKEVTINGLSGNIRFDDTGRRTNYSLEVVEMTPASELVKIGRWSDFEGLQIDNSPMLHRGFVPRPSNNLNRTYIMTTIMEEPYMMLKKQDPKKPKLVGNDRFEGYCKDLADLISKVANVNFEIRPVKDGKYGSPDPEEEGGWNGMMGELVRKEAEIAIAPLTINSQREQVADFTKPFMSLGISIMIKKPVKKRPGVFSFMSPLSEEIWMCVAFAYLGVSIVLFLVSRFSPKEWKIEGTLNGGSTVANSFSMKNCLWFVLGSIMQQGVDMTPRATSGRIVGGVWWFFSLILISSYTANLAAFLTVERMVTPINSADELSQQTEIEYGALDGGSTLSFFENSKISVYARMWEFMSARPYVLTNTTQDGIQRVRESKGKYAFLIESTTNEYTNERLPCDTMKVGKNLDAKGYGIATAKGSGLLERINMAVLKLMDKGELAKLKNKWWYENTECLDQSDQTKKNELSLSNVAGIFFILVGGLVIAMIVALAEFCINSKREAKRAKTSLSSAMKNKARLALSAGRDLDNIRFYGDSSAL